LEWEKTPYTRHFLERVRNCLTGKDFSNTLGEKSDKEGKRAREDKEGKHTGNAE
jgi:hypothetical protein